MKCTIKLCVLFVNVEYNRKTANCIKFQVYVGDILSRFWMGYHLFLGSIYLLCNRRRVIQTISYATSRCSRISSRIHHTMQFYLIHVPRTLNGSFVSKIWEMLQRTKTNIDPNGCYLTPTKILTFFFKLMFIQFGVSTTSMLFQWQTLEHHGAKYSMFQTKFAVRAVYFACAKLTAYRCSCLCVCVCAVTPLFFCYFAMVMHFEWIIWK